MKLNRKVSVLLQEWVCQHLSEHLPLNSILVLKQAKMDHNKLKLKEIVNIQQAGCVNVRKDRAEPGVVVYA
jgi:hypothetical protein